MNFPDSFQFVLKKKRKKLKKIVTFDADFNFPRLGAGRLKKEKINTCRDFDRGRA